MSHHAKNARLQAIREENIPLTLLLDTRVATYLSPIDLPPSVETRLQHRLERIDISEGKKPMLSTCASIHEED